MTRIFFTVTTLLLICLQCRAIGSRDALLAARQFAEEHRTSCAKGDGSDIHLTEVSIDDALFCYNVSDGGFVIVADVNGEAGVIGYADRGSINANDIPEPMRMWISGAASIATRSNAARTTIEPLVKCQWSQLEPYNIQCPKKGSKNTVTGCVATAMAQVLYCIQPTGSTALDSYTTKTDQLTCNALPATTFNWKLLSTTYGTTDTSASADEVAKLMRYCGQSTEMDYSSVSGTPAENVVYAMRTAFDLSSSCHQVFRTDYTAVQWHDIIYGELAARRPVIICGNTTSEGHAFVCDGYDGNGFYHINWGWNGECNGYFLIDCLTPYHPGNDGCNDGYSNNITAIIGMKKKAANEAAVYSLKAMEVVTLKQSTCSRTGTDRDFSFNANLKFKNLNRNVSNWQLCWALYDEQGKQVQIGKTISATSIAYNATGTCTIIGNLGSGCTNGKYRLVPMSRQSGAKEWLPCEYEANGSFMLTISGKSCTVQQLRKAYADMKYTASAITVSGNMVSSYAQRIEATVTNVGTSHVGTLYIFVDGRMRRTLSVGIDPGETGTIATYISLGSGTHTVSVAAQSAIITQYDMLCTTTATVTQEQYCMLSQMQLSVETDGFWDGNTYVVAQPSAVVVCDLANATATPYNSDIRIYYNDTNFNDRTYIIYANVPANGSARVRCTIDNLPEGSTVTLRPVLKTGASSWSVYNVGIKLLYDSTTGITQHHADDSRHDAVYTIDGRHASSTSALPHGMYIMNGNIITK